MSLRIVHIIDRLDCYGTSRQLSLLVHGLPPAEFRNCIGALAVSPCLPEELRHLVLQRKVDDFTLHIGVLASSVPPDIDKIGRPCAVVLATPVCVLASRGLMDPMWPVRLWRLLGQMRPQVIHAWGRRANLVAALAATIQPKAALVLSQRWTAEPPQPGEAMLQSALLAKARKIVVNSAAVWDQLAARGVPKEKLALMVDAVVPAAPPSVSRRQLLNELGLPGDVRLVCTGGALYQHKGIKDAIWAADLLKVCRRDVHLLVAGDGPQLQQLLLFRDQVRIADKVHFLGCRTDHRWIVAHCDVFWATAHRGGQPTAILEAMAAGVPVVATQVPGNAELVQHDVTGYLIAPGDRAALARFTNQLLDHPELAQRLGRAAQKHALAHFAAAKVTARYAQLYRELL